MSVRPPRDPYPHDGHIVPLRGSRPSPRARLLPPLAGFIPAACLKRSRLPGKASLRYGACHTTPQGRLLVALVEHCWRAGFPSRLPEPRGGSLCSDLGPAICCTHPALPRRRQHLDQYALLPWLLHEVGDQRLHLQQTHALLGSILAIFLACPLGDVVAAELGRCA